MQLLSLFCVVSRKKPTAKPFKQLHLCSFKKICIVKFVVDFQNKLQFCCLQNGDGAKSSFLPWSVNPIKNPLGVFVFISWKSAPYVLQHQNSSRLCYSLSRHEGSRGNTSKSKITTAHNQERHSCLQNQERFLWFLRWRLFCSNSELRIFSVWVLFWSSRSQINWAAGTDSPQRHNWDTSFNTGDKQEVEAPQ